MNARFGAHRFRLLVALLPAAIAATPLHAQTNMFSGTVALSSQLVDRGLAITPVTPVLQAAGSWATTDDWVFGLSAGTQARSPRHGSDTLLQVDHYWLLSDDWRMQAGLAYYAYPGNASARAFDRAEASMNWLYRDVLTFGLSAISLTRGYDHQPRGAADANFRWPLPAHFSLNAGLGVAQPLPAGSYYGGSSDGAWTYFPGYGTYRGQRPSSYYGYGQLGLAWDYGAWRVELDRIATDPSQRWMAAAPWVATIAWSF
ncbi:MAG TPA: hypothetical protein VMA74_19275 [Dyella sp.]|uniref:hypothetical protein n=1 Tax=Dyella sp. TaxID=1869338 RepID=UPI002BB381F8|nr:hypothetical protein [Dyella sp.]HUB91871.1 hypothetical protein [Dyella sp.]